MKTFPRQISHLITTQIEVDINIPIHRATSYTVQIKTSTYSPVPSFPSFREDRGLCIVKKVDRKHTDSATPECRQYHTHDRLLITALPFVNVTAVQIITILNTVWVQVYGSNHITLSILFKSFVNTAYHTSYIQIASFGYFTARKAS